VFERSLKASSSTLKCSNPLNTPCSANISQVKEHYQLPCNEPCVYLLYPHTPKPRSQHRQPNIGIAPYITSGDQILSGHLIHPAKNYGTLYKNAKIGSVRPFTTGWVIGTLESGMVSQSRKRRSHSQRTRHLDVESVSNFGLSVCCLTCVISGLERRKNIQAHAAQKRHPITFEQRRDCATHLADWHELSVRCNS
jgi:hypothetical protein